MPQKLSYPEIVIEPLRYQFCPMCRAQLIRKVIFDDNIPRITCPECRWIQMMNNAVCVAVVAHHAEGIVVIEPPGEDGIGLPAGLIEYGETPEAAAVREVYEETGFEVKIVDNLGWFFINRSDWPGPTLYFMYEAEVVGGALKGSEEGTAKIAPLQNFPPIATGREGSQRAIKAYFSKIQRHTL